MKSWRKVFILSIFLTIVMAVLSVKIEIFWTFFLVCAMFSGLMLYFIPTIIANERKHRNEGAIGLLNFFIGWTFIGWIICLIWAETNQEPIKVSNVDKSNNNKYDDLEKLQKLKDNGTITEEEFIKEKEKILK